MHPRRVFSVLAIILFPGVIATGPAECRAQVPWQVPSAYWQPTTCYYSPSTQYGAAWSAATSSSLTGGAQTAYCNPACCQPCSCCQKPNGSDNPPPDDKEPPVEPPSPPRPDDKTDDGKGADNPPDQNEETGLTSYRQTRYAVRQVNIAAVSRSSASPVTGRWRSKFGNVDLHRNGNTVVGTTAYTHGGVIDMKGQYDLGVLTLSYQHRSQPGIRGKVAFHYDAKNAQFVGKTRNAVNGRESDWLLSK